MQITLLRTSLCLLLAGMLSHIAIQAAIGAPERDKETVVEVKEQVFEDKTRNIRWHARLRFFKLKSFSRPALSPVFSRDVSRFAYGTDQRNN